MSDLEIDVESALEALRNQNVGEIINMSQKNADYRQILSSSDQIWDYIHSNLSDQLLPLIANIAASPQGNESAHAFGIPELLVQNVQSLGHIRQYWTALSNTCQLLPVDVTAELVTKASSVLIEFPTPILQFVLAEIKNGAGGLDELITKGLDLYTTWYDNELPAATIFNKVVEACIADESIVPLLNNDNVVLFKVLDAVINANPQPVPESITRAVERKYTELAEQTPHLFGKLHETEWTLLILYMEILTHILEADPTLKHKMPEAVNVTVDILANCKKLLPAYNKLSSQPDELRIEDWPMVRSTAISLLSQLVVQNPAAQNRVRENGGLALVLEACVLDGNNPYMKERAIICVRYLLENNDENQQFVASLEAKQVVDADKLEKAGLEAEVVDGKLQLKGKPKPQQRQP